VTDKKIGKEKRGGGDEGGEFGGRPRLYITLTLRTVDAVAGASLDKPW